MYQTLGPGQMKSNIGYSSGHRKKTLTSVTKNRSVKFRLRLDSKTFHTCSKTTLSGFKITHLYKVVYFFLGHPILEALVIWK